MKKKELKNLLTEHAESLNKNKDVEARLLGLHPRDSAELTSLFRLAEAVRAALVPVPQDARPSPAFRARLQRDLLLDRRAEIVIGESVSRQRFVWFGVAAIGSLLSVAGVALLLLRRLRSGGETVTRAAAT